MLWPIVLPFKITLWSLAGIVAMLTVASPAFAWPRARTFFISTLVAIVAFVPSCAAIMSIVDAHRFGIFHYDTFTEVHDFRIERYLPTTASNITVENFAMGHRAKYEISEAELRMYVDGLWAAGGEYSAVDRDEFEDGVTVDYEQFAHRFDGLGWPPFESVMLFQSPVQGDGGGATYYFDPQTSTAYHRAAYW